MVSDTGETKSQEKEAEALQPRTLQKTFTLTPKNNN